VETIAFALPVKPGMVERGYKFIQELGKERADEHHELHKSHGFKVMKIWYQTEPVEMVIIYLEAPELDSARQNFRNSGHTFDQWFQDMVREVTGQPPINFQATLLLDWDRDQRHRYVATPPSG
jgi:hypothetical protein